MHKQPHMHLYIRMHIRVHVRIHIHMYATSPTPPRGSIASASCRRHPGLTTPGSHHWDRIREVVARHHGASLNSKFETATAPVEVDLGSATATAFAAVEPRPVRELAAQGRGLQKDVED